MICHAMTCHCCVVSDAPYRMVVHLQQQSARALVHQGAGCGTIVPDSFLLIQFLSALSFDSPFHFFAEIVGASCNPILASSLFPLLVLIFIPSSIILAIVVSLYRGKVCWEVGWYVRVNINSGRQSGGWGGRTSMNNSAYSHCNSGILEVIGYRFKLNGDTGAPALKVFNHVGLADREGCKLEALSVSRRTTLILLKDHHFINRALGISVDSDSTVVSNVEIYSVSGIGSPVLFQTQDDFFTVTPIALVLIDPVQNIGLGISDVIQWFDGFLLLNVLPQLVVLGGVETLLRDIVLIVGISHHPRFIAVFIGSNTAVM